MQEIIDLLKQSPVADHAEYIAQQSRVLVRLEESFETPGSLQSRFSGKPVLPEGFAWPEHDDGYYRFLLQINFADLPNVDAEIPRTGILTLFEKFNEDGDMDWTAPDYIVAAYINPEVELVSTDPPDETEIPDAVYLDFNLGVDIPLFDSDITPTVKGWPISDDQMDDYSGTRDLIQDAENYMFGYPTNRCLGFDPSPGPDWIQLFNLEENEELEWYFHDGSKLMIFIEKERLAVADFSNLKTIAG